MLQLSTRAPLTRGHPISKLLEYNKEWAEAVKTADPTYFSDLAKVQKPQFLWIGCSDSRVPANQIVGLLPGELFVHRNVANVVARADLNCLAVIQFAIDHIQVEHVMVCGHYGCGGVRAAHEDARLGLVDNWILHVADVKTRYIDILDQIAESSRVDALCELNVIEQLANVAETHIVKDNWSNADTPVKLHGWIYGLQDGILYPLIDLQKGDDVRACVRTAVAGVIARHWKGHGGSRESSL
jgi:carbonic anhydrase